MASFGNLVLTASGLQAQAELQGGANIEYCDIVMGDGNFTGNVLSLTELVNTKMTLPITNGYIQNGAYTVEAYIDNADLTEGFYWREIGVMIKKSDGTKVLYNYANAGVNYDFIPATTDGRYAKRIRVALPVDSAESVTIVESEGLTFVDMVTYKERINEVETTLLASGWDGNGCYSFEAEYPHSSYNLEITLPRTNTKAQIKAFQEAMILGGTNENIIGALGVVPTIDIPIMLKAVKK